MTLDKAIKHCEEVATKMECESMCVEEAYQTAKQADCEKCAKEHRQLAEWLKELKKLREQTRWIPVSERLPEEHEWIGTAEFGITISDEVYVTFESPKGERFTKHLSFQNGKVSNFVQSEIDAFHKGSVPIAWMPLTEPYKAESEDKI